MEYLPPPTIKTSVVACVIDTRERVLLMRRTVEPFHGYWIMPGGKIEHGEPILSALHREVAEEVGIEVLVEGLIDVYEHLGVGGNGDHFVILYYRATPLSLELRPDGIECDEAIWSEKATLPQLELAPGARHILAQVFPELVWAPTEEHAELCSAEAPLFCPVPKD
jgi:8-oxo-dGTP diphosphatase